MNAVHLASSRQVHLSFNGVIVDVGTHATRQFLCPPIEIRFATLVAAAQPFFDCTPQAFPDGKLHHRRLPRLVPHRGKLRVHDFIDQDPLYWGLRTEFLNDRFTHAAVDRNLLGLYYRPQRPWRASQPARRAKNFAGSFFRTDVIDGHSLLSCRDSNPNSISIPLCAEERSCTELATSKLRSSIPGQHSPFSCALKEGHQLLDHGIANGHFAGCPSTGLRPRVKSDIDRTQ